VHYFTGENELLGPEEAAKRRSEEGNRKEEASRKAQGAIAAEEEAARAAAAKVRRFDFLVTVPVAGVTGLRGRVGQAAAGTQLGVKAHQPTSPPRGANIKGHRAVDQSAHPCLSLHKTKAEAVAAAQAATSHRDACITEDARLAKEAQAKREAEATPTGNTAPHTPRLWLLEMIL